MTERFLPNVRLPPVRSQEQQLRSQAALLLTTYLITCCISTVEGLYVAGVFRPSQSNEPDEPDSDVSVRIEGCMMICSKAIEEGS